MGAAKIADSMGHNFANRLARAAEESRTSGVDALIVTPSPDLEYLLGYEAPLLERLTALVTRPGKDPVLIVPQLLIATGIAVWWRRRSR